MRTASWVILRYRADVSFEAGSVPSSLLDSTAGPGSLVVIRFRGTDLPTDQGLAALREAVSILAQCPGFLSGAIGQSTDDPELLLLALTWRDIGSYRRALSRMEVKMRVVPLLSHAVDEPTAFEMLHRVDESGVQSGSSGLAADASSVRLGEAAQPRVARVQP